MRIDFALTAQRDLIAIETYVSADSPVRAARLMARLRAATDSLLLFPLIGRPSVRSGARELVTVRPYVIVYVVEAERVVIERIFHGAQRR